MQPRKSALWRNGLSRHGPSGDTRKGVLPKREISQFECDADRHVVATVQKPSRKGIDDAGSQCLAHDAIVEPPAFIFCAEIEAIPPIRELLQ